MHKISVLFSTSSYGIGPILFTARRTQQPFIGNRKFCEKKSHEKDRTCDDIRSGTEENKEEEAFHIPFEKLSVDELYDIFPESAPNMQPPSFWPHTEAEQLTKEDEDKHNYY